MLKYHINRILHYKRKRSNFFIYLYLIKYNRISYYTITASDSFKGLSIFFLLTNVQKVLFLQYPPPFPECITQKDKNDELYHRISRV